MRVAALGPSRMAQPPPSTPAPLPFSLHRAGLGPAAGLCSDTHNPFQRQRFCTKSWGGRGEEVGLSWAASRNGGFLTRNHGKLLTVAAPSFHPQKLAPWPGFSRGAGSAGTAPHGAPGELPLGTGCRLPSLGLRAGEGFPAGRAPVAHATACTVPAGDARPAPVGSAAWGRLQELLEWKEILLRPFQGENCSNAAY